MKVSKLIACSIFCSAMSLSANATLLTTTSLTTEGTTPVAITEIGGIVVDLVGTNGTRVISQLAASSLYDGFFYSNPGAIGSQSGFDNAIYSNLGGGISEASIRLTVYDGDTAAGNFDFGQNDLLINGLNFGDFSSVLTENTDSSGTVSYGTNNGFANNRLATGWFYSMDSTLLSDLFTSIVGTEALSFSLDDVDYGDNYFDFTQGLDGSLIDVGTGPVVTNPVPEPTTLVLLGLAIAGFGFSCRKKFN